MSNGERLWGCTLKFALGVLLDNSLDLVVGDGLLSTAGQVNNGDVGGRNTHGHSSELSVQGRNDLSDSLGGTSAAGNDVLSSGTTTTPVLGGGTINSLLGGSVGVDGGHETLNETPVVVDNLSERGQAVGGARSVRNDGVLALVGFVIDTHDEHLDASVIKKRPERQGRGH